MGVISSPTLNLLAKNVKTQIDSNNAFIKASELEVNELLEDAKKQISKYFDDLFNMDLPIDVTAKIDFNNHDGEGDYRIAIIYEPDRKFAYFIANWCSEILISDTHIYNNVAVDYTSEDEGRRYNFGFKPEQDHKHNEKACRMIMGGFERIQNKFNMRILTYLNDEMNDSDEQVKNRKKALSLLSLADKKDE